MTPLFECRLCGCSDLLEVLDLGVHALSGVFPATADEDAALTRGPLRLVRCTEPTCELVQLDTTYDLDVMYGDNYGYRSGLNAGMVVHLTGIARSLQAQVGLGPTDIVLDIGSNDGTLLAQYTKGPKGPVLVGFDPTAEKFAQYYRNDIDAVPEFFSADEFREAGYGNRKAKLVTAISMLYDLPDPQRFINDVASILAPDGLFFCEQSYVGAMIDNLAYDTVCHEHLEYYGLKQIRRMLSAAGLNIMAVEANDTNGGSFAVTAGHGPEAWQVADIIAGEEAALGPDAWANFGEAVEDHAVSLAAKLIEYRDAGKIVYGLGASTKGNTLLQYCGIGDDLVPAIAEVNPDKYGRLTPGTKIPIISMADSELDGPDLYLVLPWHFRAGFESRRKPGEKLLFPLPEIEVVG